jgi:hypothetical protein
MNYLPWIIGGAAVGYFARRGTGRRASNGPSPMEASREKYYDHTTGELMPPYPGAGAPRKYNSLETKRVRVLSRELQKEYNKIREGGHMWDPVSLGMETGDLFSIANDLQTHPVCDGEIVFRNKPGLFTRNRYECAPLPVPKLVWVGSEKKGNRRQVEWGTTGERMLHSAWKGRVGGKEAQRKKRAKAAREAS